MAVVSWVVEVQFPLVLRTMLTLGVPAFSLRCCPGFQARFSDAVVVIKMITALIILLIPF